MTSIDLVRRRLVVAVAKWSAWILAVLVLWATRVLHVVFLLCLLLMQEVWRFLGWLSAPTKMGAKAYWSAYWQYWAVAYAVLLFLFGLWWVLWYRHKRPNLRIEGIPEGRVVWMKGLRRGLVYDVWDARRYLRWRWRRWTKKKVPKVRVMANGGERVPVWPSPLSIPLGRSVSTGRIIYFSRPWSIRLDRLLVPSTVPIRSTYHSVELPRGYIYAVPDAERPGRTVFVFSNEGGTFYRYDPKRPFKDIDKVLSTGREQVMAATAANPEIIGEDFSTGSIPMWKSNSDRHDENGAENHGEED